MERFETLFEKNLPERGGSFYMQSKIYNAKQHLMMDFPDELNMSKFNPGQEDLADKDGEGEKDQAKGSDAKDSKSEAAAEDKQEESKSEEKK